MADAERLYLDLLKRVLTRTLDGREPDIDSWRFPTEFLEHYVRGPAYSMLPVGRFDHLERCMNDVLRENVPGDFIETGIWRGGATIFMRAFLKLHDVTDRRVWAADSFQGFPAPDPEKFPNEARAHASKAMTEDFGRLAVSRAEVEENFARFGMLDDQVRFLEGWFKDTLPSAPIERLSIMRLDGDFYESTRDALTNLYDKLSPGGFVIIDDYRESSWTYCSKAVDEFRQARGITAELLPIDSKAFYWRRER